jgi:hypothetical protein
LHDRLHLRVAALLGTQCDDAIRHPAFAQVALPTGGTWLSDGLAPLGSRAEVQSAQHKQSRDRDDEDAGDERGGGPGVSQEAAAGDQQQARRDTAPDDPELPGPRLARSLFLSPPDRLRDEHVRISV